MSTAAPADNGFYSAQVKLENAREVRRAIRRLQGDLSALGPLNEQVALIVMRYAKSMAPRRTGTLAGDMRAAKTRARASIRMGRARVPYAGPVHWGWPTRPEHSADGKIWGGPIKGNPFISKAAQTSEPSWTIFYAQQLQKLATKAERAAQ